MKFQTNIPLESQSENQIDYHSNVLLFGSCFSENIGEKLSYFKFKNTQNPLGILFHPKAIETLISKAVNGYVYTQDDVFYHNEQWHCFDAHSKLSHPSKAHLLNQLNVQINVTALNLKKASHIVITLGTAWVYTNIETKQIVANCHKIPQKQFKKELLSVAKIEASLKNTLSLIKSVNPSVSVLFTVSPIRHIKDGFVENTQSKAHLIAAIHQVLKGQSYYFPSFEIMMDELRDYRFYKADMIHPSPLAVTYIWEKFKTVWISEASFKTMEAVNVIQKGREHKPFNEASEAHQKFLKNLQQKTKALQILHKHIQF
ncbi:GSCFA domain-containing protein [Algibacter pectinivorans]|uniref:GSCFA family protein n=1 Tax=Algibacter pectinivorans TaxID=870482 RepID=A0A1I1PUH7_9FLAO|nr:GSCFA domain-containing protein [Algibacter pectinivorans]SFD13347.1 GSCFA family protein [Algibacter pectinivorans]